ncbi:unnamed protein product [Cylindrotheca closterium]|uniref:Uncharacterized protein n=1 Tax=Cylindrotheca closterium TaxID=2856 RepID=A0AAD2JIF9_9STRA|nr:unnamed protein product [Cylindrotheca closterium]
MEIAEYVFHFNDKSALDNQSIETSIKVYNHFWQSFEKNPLVKEFLSKDLFDILESYLLVSFYPAYGAAVLYQNNNSLQVFVRTIGLDGWKKRIPSSSHGREQHAVPNLEESAIMDQGPISRCAVVAIGNTLAKSLRESETNNRGDRRRKSNDHEGNQKTPSFLNEKLGQSIKKVISGSEVTIGEQSAYGGTTDVGMHTGAKKKNTAAPLAFATASTMLRLAGRPQHEFKALMAAYLISFLDVLPKLATYDARAMDRYVIVMREAKPFIEGLRNKAFQQKILHKMRTHHEQLYSVSYGPPQQLNLCGVSETVEDLFPPEFPMEPWTPQIQENETKVDRFRGEAEKNLLWVDMESTAFSGHRSEAWVQLHSLNLKFWNAASSLKYDYTTENVALLKKDLDRLSIIVEVAMAATDEGRYTMSVVIRSYELLAAIICFCCAHVEMEGNHEWFKKYTPAFNPKNLHHLVLDDNRAVDGCSSTTISR